MSSTYPHTEAVSPVPVVSIGMPIYNDGRFAREAISSLLSQTFRDFELIISDNDSTDDTGAICRSFAATDPRIRYIRQAANVGLTNNLNFVLGQARGEFFMWAASDDWWHPTFIERMLHALRADTSAVSAFGPYAFMDDDGKRIGMIRRADYSSRSRLWRLAKLAHAYDDGCFYGLHRRAPLSGVRIPTWTGVNAATPFNNAYPPLFYLLARGNFVFVPGEPLWVNRLRRRSSHLATIPDSAVRKYVALVRRKLEVLRVSAAYVWAATHSWSTVLAILPLLIGRCWYDCIERIVQFIARRALGINIGLEAKLVEGWRRASAS